MILHLELLDAWGESVKALGRLEVQLVAPGEIADEGRVTVWDVNLSTVNEHARHWDRATRTYRVPLRDVPAGVEEVLRGGRAASGARFLIRAAFTLGDDPDEGHTLQDDLELRP